MLTNIRRRDQHFRQRYRIIWQKVELKEILGVWISVDDTSNIDDQTNGQLGDIVYTDNLEPSLCVKRIEITCGCCLASEKDDTAIDLFPFCGLQTLEDEVPLTQDQRIIPPVRTRRLHGWPQEYSKSGVYTRGYASINGVRNGFFLVRTNNHFDLNIEHGVGPDFKTQSSPDIMS